MYYKREEKLVLKKKVYITDEAYELLRKEKTKRKLSMAKINSNLIISKYKK